MARRSPYNRAIFDEWDALVNASYREPLAAWIRERWQLLWDEHIADGHIGNTSCRDAALICSLGYSLAMHESNYAEAESRIRTWLNHPAGCSDAIELMGMRESLTWTLLYQQRIREAAVEITTMLDDVSPKHASMSTVGARNILFGWFHELDPERDADTELARLAAIVLHRWPNRKRAAVKVERGGLTNGQIAKLLESTYPACE